jgi:spermidine synthase
MPHQSSTHGDTNTVTSSITRSWWKDRLIYFVFFLSGAAALIYEISWTRQIGLLFGHTVHAASIVLASYFAGMAIGYWVGARMSSRVSPLFGYALAELLVAVWAVAIPVFLGISESTAFAPWLSSSSFFWQTVIRGVFGFLLLLPATIALGVTLPMMATYFAGNGRERLSVVSDASRVTMAYALNTAGALVGVLLATFYLLLVVGVRTSSFAAAGLSVFCAVAALLLGRESRDKSGGSSDNFSLDSKLANLDSPNPGLSALAFLSGFGILALQVLYTRMFSLVFHNSTYTFGVVIAVFLASLALGAAIASNLQRRHAAQRIIGVASGLGALATTGSVLVFVWITELKYFSFGDSFVQYMSGAIFLVTVVVAPAIICLGMMLPLVWTMAGKAGSAGRVVGNLTAINTIAAAMGASSASFIMLIWIGLWQSIVLIAILFFVAAFLLLWQNKQTQTAIAMGLLTGVVSALALSSPIDSEFDRTEYHEQIVQRWNSPYGWIDVVQNDKTGSFKIRQNLHYRFGKTGGNVREFRQAHIPILLHDDPQDVLFIGLGTGLTAGGAIPHPEVKKIVAVELIPEVIDAVRSLSKFNYNVVDDPNVEIHIDDARHYLLANDRKFDVIVSDLFVPWESESGYLYTVEHYEVALKRMKPEGLFCQWLPLYQLGEKEFESIANSFANVFPHTTIWWGQLETTSPVIALIGARSPLTVDSNNLAKRLERLSGNLLSPDQSIATPELFWDHYIGDWQLQSSSKFNTDEHPRVEFLTPISNRDGKMIRGNLLEEYYEEVLSPLPANGAILGDQGVDSSSTQRRSRQRLILFGQ